ncbi:MAG: hypothetical protein IJ662_07100 [Clostridia bacterium]|nr:hypothetical protein [Clostridia bacterium]
MRKKSIIRRLLSWIIALALIAALVIFVGIPLYSQKDEQVDNPPSISYYEGEGKKLTMENDSLAFELDENNTHFQLTDKRTGKTWYSNPQDRASDPIALTSNKDTLSATLLVTYTTSSGEVTLNNYAYSIQNQTYTVEQLEDQAIQVEYSVGEIEKVFMIPTAITKERYNAFTDNMSKSTKKKLSSNYSLVEPDKLDSRSNKDELIAMYPSITEQALYILKSETSADNKGKIEGYFKEGGYTEEDFAIDEMLVAQKADNSGPVFNVTVIYRLEDDELTVEIPYKKIRYKAEYPITYVSVLPMFGAAGTQQEGAIMLPEGGGALIRYNNGKLSQNPYYANLYGWDYGIQRKEAVSETKNTFPVFGMMQPDGSFICVMEGSNSYAGVNADISGRYNSYNTVYAMYNVLHYDQYNVSAKTPRLVYMYENDLPEGSILQRYRPVAGGDYVAMATAYGDYLQKHYPEMQTKQVSEDMPVNVELVGAINKMQVKFGLPIDSVVATTTFDQALEIITDLSNQHVNALNVRMTGWSNGGVRQKVLTGVHVVGAMGGEKGLKKLAEEAKKQGVSLFFDGITCFAYHSNIFDGFSTFSDTARHTTREQVKLYPYDIVTYQPAEWLDEFYLVKPSYAKQNASNLIHYLQDKQVSGVAFRDIGNLLSADYYSRELVTREQVKQLNIETMQEARAAGEKVIIKEGNEYAVPYADLITDMNLSGIPYAIIDDHIPFYQIALHGHQDYTGSAINLEGDYQTALLECAEYGAGLNFTFMYANTAVLQDTNYSCFTSSGYQNWKEHVTAMITRYQQEMKGLNRLAITGHEILADNVTATTYEDGTTVYVNYNTTAYDAGALQIPARDYLVERGNER